MTKLNIGVLFLLLTLLFSCKKKNDDSVLGLDVQPTNDLVGITITDTSSIFMHTQKVDAVRSYNDQYKYLGSNIDPVFGRTDASIYTNFSISNNLTDVTFGARPMIDSSEMVLVFMGNELGDTLSSLTYDIHLLSEQPIGDSLYRTNSVLKKSGSKICSAKGIFRVANNYLCLVLPLDNNFSQYVLQTTANLTNNTAFQSAYKGFYITTSNSGLGGPGSGAIRRFDLDNDLSGVNMYYHDGNSASSRGQVFQFSFRGVDALRFNEVKHDYSASHHYLYDQLTGPKTADTLKGNANVYLNSFGGTRARVYLPYLKNFNDSVNVSISRAELIIKVDDIVSPTSTDYACPANLALIACNSAGEEELVYDQLETTDFVKYDGNYDATNKQYTFNIARQMQKILNGSVGNYGFYLVNALPNRAYVIRRDNRLERVVIGGKTNMNFKPKFKVTYVKYPYDK